MIVKPLDFKWHEAENMYIAKTSIGEYFIEHSNKWFFEFNREASDTYWSLAETISVANKDHQRRIMSCLINDNE